MNSVLVSGDGRMTFHMPRRDVFWRLPFEIPTLARRARRGTKPNGATLSCPFETTAVEIETVNLSFVLTSPSFLGDSYRAGVRRGRWAVNLFVKAKDLGGVEHTIICDGPKRALEIEKDEKATGCEVWVEDANGKRIDDAGLNALAERGGANNKVP